MTPAKSVGRTVGALLILQMAGLIVPFVLLHPLTSAYFLVDAAPAAQQIRIAVLLLFANCALTIAISILSWKILREYSSAMALLLVIAAVVMFTLQAMDNIQIVSMLSLSERHASGVGARELGALASVFGTARKWTHYSELVSIDLWILLFHYSLYRFALVPRIIAGFGMLTVAIHFTALVLPMMLGLSGITPLGATMALGHLFVAGWLLPKGFAVQDSANRTAACT